MWQPKGNENQTVLAAAIHTPDSNTGPLESIDLEFRDCGTIPGRGQLLIAERQIGEFEGGDCQGKCLWRKAGQPRKQGDNAVSHVGGGAITIASLSPYASVSSSTIERLTHQILDILNYRVGPDTV